MSRYSLSNMLDEKRHQVKVDHKLIVTLMLDPRANELVKTLVKNYETVNRLH